MNIKKKRYIDIKPHCFGHLQKAVSIYLYINTYNICIYIYIHTYLMAILDIHEATNGDEYDYGMPKNLI